MRWFFSYFFSCIFVACSRFFPVVMFHEVETAYSRDLETGSDRGNREIRMLDCLEITP